MTTTWKRWARWWLGRAFPLDADPSGAFRRPADPRSALHAGRLEPAGCRGGRTSPEETSLYFPPPAA